MDHNAIALKTAENHLATLTNMAATAPHNQMLSGLIAEAQAKVNSLKPTPVAAQATPTPNEWGAQVEQRLGALEQLVQKVAAPAISEAAQAGVAIMGALGKAMSQDQAEWVQKRLETSPEFFTTSDCHEAVGIFIAEWRNFEERKAAK